MKKLNLGDLVVSTFEVQAPLASLQEPYAGMDRTPDTHCFDCGPSAASCEALCLPGPGGGL